LQAYYEQWGWNDFLIEVSKTKMFDIQGSGLDSVECAEKAQAYKVLMYASNEKEKNQAINSLYKK
jgi:hypothetical protein